MDNGSLLLVPAGGLANRMRAVVSAYRLCCDTDSRLQVVWIRDWALNARFGDIFLPVDKSLFNIREAITYDYILNDRPRRRNLWLPKLPQKMIYSGCIYEHEITPLKQKGFDFEGWLRGKRRYMSCYQEFGIFDHALYKHIFRPVRQVTDIASGYQQMFSANTIGMHIRRTDNRESIEKSPTELFIDAAQREIDAHADTKIYLATDSDEVKKIMRGMFGKRVITPDAAAERGSVAGIRMAVAEMWTLAATRRIYGSAGSSYSTMAASVGGTDLAILSNQE